MIDGSTGILIGALSVVTSVYWIIIFIDTLYGRRFVSTLSGRKDTFKEKLPGVSIIVTAKDEERSIGRSLRTLMKLDYPDFEVIVVDDRSTDKTLDEIAEVQKVWSGLKVISIDTLPDGWLGKNYACYRGYTDATKDILLFTDADVIFKPDALRIAVMFFCSEKDDHLAVSPLIYGESFLLRLFVQYFLFSFLIYFRPWAGGMGVGAFNMFRREAYERAGTHRAVSLRPDEDLQIGKRVKKAGLRQRFASGKHFVSVRWYATLREAMRGIEKNAFAGLRYSIVIAAGAMAGQTLIFLFPFIAVFITAGWTQLLYIAVLIMMVSVYLLHIRVFSKSRGYDVIFLPVSALLFIITIGRALIKTVIQGGIHWRGTFYPLRDLRKS